MAVTEIFESPEDSGEGKKDPAPRKRRAPKTGQGNSSSAGQEAPSSKGGSKPRAGRSPVSKENPEAPRKRTPPSAGGAVKSPPRKPGAPKKNESSPVSSKLPKFKGFGFLEPVIRFVKLLFHFREKLFAGSLKKSLNIPLPLTVSWQPIWWVGIKVTILLIAYNYFYNFHPVVAGWLKEGLEFFRLSEIYKFDFPGKETFLTISRYLFIGLIVYSGTFFFLPLWQGLFSSIAVSRKTGQIYYSANMLISRKLHIISISNTDSISLVQNPVFRLLNMGTLVIYRKAGETISIRGIKRVSVVMKDLSLIKSS